jgi:hypothetical protein
MRRRWALFVAAILIVAQLPMTPSGRLLSCATTESESDEQGKESADSLVASRGHHRARLRKRAMPPIDWSRAAFGIHLHGPLATAAQPAASRPPQSDLARRNGLGAPLRC